MNISSPAIALETHTWQSSTCPSTPCNPQDDTHDVTLLNEIALQSSTALMQFYQRYNATIMAFAMNHLWSEQDSREILNEVLLTIWSSASTFTGRSSVRTWVLGITHHKTMDYLRKYLRDRRTKEAYLQEQETVTADNTLEQSMMALDSATPLRQCLNKLSRAHREVLHLAFYEDLSCREIAIIQGCPIGTVKTRIMHAKEKMKALLGQDTL